MGSPPKDRKIIQVRVREAGHIIILREREGGVRANLDAAGGGTYLIFPLVKLILGPPPPFLIIIAQSLRKKISNISDQGALTNNNSLVIFVGI